jgi:hypothetical protein
MYSPNPDFNFWPLKTIPRKTGGVRFIDPIGL